MKTSQMNFFYQEKTFRVEGNPSKLCAVIASVERSEIIKITTKKENRKISHSK